MICNRITVYVECVDIQGGWDLWSIYLGSRIREPKPRGFDWSIRMVGFMSAALPFSAPAARQTRAARAHAAASTRSCPPREFHEVAGTARGTTLALGAVSRALAPVRPSPGVLEIARMSAERVWCMRPA